MPTSKHRSEEEKKSYWAVQRNTKLLQTFSGKLSIF